MEAKLWKLEKMSKTLANPRNPQKFFGKKPSLEYYANRHHSQRRSRSPQTDWSPWDQVTMQPWRQKTTPWCHNPWFKRLNTKTKSSPLPFQDLMWCATTCLKSTGNLNFKSLSTSYIPSIIMQVLQNQTPTVFKTSQAICPLSHVQPGKLWKVQAPASYLSTSRVVTFALSLSNGQALWSLLRPDWERKDSLSTLHNLQLCRESRRTFFVSGHSHGSRHRHHLFITLQMKTKMDELPEAEKQQHISDKKGDCEDQGWLSHSSLSDWIWTPVHSPEYKPVNLA